MARIRATAPTVTEPFPIRGVIIWPHAYDVVMYPYLAQWILCNGAGGSPDYREHHLRGATNDAQVNTAIGADAHTHVVNASSGDAGAHTHTIGDAPDHTHTIDEYCHDHTDANHDGRLHGDTLACADTVCVDDNLDGSFIEVAGTCYCVIIAEDFHNHGDNTEGNDGATGSDGKHTHTLGDEPDHSHTVAAVALNASSIPLTKYCHFIQYIG